MGEVNRPHHCADIKPKKNARKALRVRKFVTPENLAAKLAAADKRASAKQLAHKAATNLRKAAEHELARKRAAERERLAAEQRKKQLKRERREKVAAEKRERQAAEKRAREQKTDRLRAVEKLEPFRRADKGLSAEQAADNFRYHEKFKNTSVMCVFCQKDFSDPKWGYKNPKAVKAALTKHVAQGRKGYHARGVWHEG